MAGDGEIGWGVKVFNSSARSRESFSAMEEFALELLSVGGGSPPVVDRATPKNTAATSQLN
jgi:hypothetical protein